MNSISTEGISSLQSALVRQRIDTAVLAKTHDAAKQQGEAALGLLDAAAETSSQSVESNSRHVDVTA